ncbi:hypothetical protein SEA_YEET_61 [Mycobacterium phage Yeet]|uniref:Uncharacterized protein n=4 Tax=Omegavirus TaxID=1623292 RepID=A0A3S9UAU6_9CAUD|nr:hypothetical protein N860_gp060 [Mycobacterium phage Redno2]YP_008410458.1 hypothetical protein N857_gp069 [Mycobacterium phage Wanda]YP_009011959.1 hypothetical protein CM09_gp060 [Mycobacterium phage Courthouse]YP_009124022.1 hypothetical protein VC71_gp069 [Mycobacterium phage Minerva]YP_009205190.1 hypothetical protein AVT17_gp060 [Mycobacterium phage Ariel]YP_009213277.1 hypothetical protein AVV70_gp060 [Mycobacterium phage MiaZeal]YP_009590924.1 hypothetical protein FDG54_gp068 [Myco
MNRHVFNKHEFYGAGYGPHVSVEIPDITHTTVTNAINALDDVYRSVRADLTRLLEKA